MALVTTIGSASADSYISAAEADTYLSARASLQSGTLYTDWTGLSTTAKEYQLRLAAKFLDSLMFRGIKACLEQSLEFPRLFRGDSLWPTEVLPLRSSYPGELLSLYRTQERYSDALADRYATWADLTTVADALGLTAPVIPQAVKDAQAEVVFQVILGILSKLRPADSATGGLSQLTIGKVSMQIESLSVASEASEYSLFQASVVGSQSVISILLRSYLAKVRGFVV